MNVVVGCGICGWCDEMWWGVVGFGGYGAVWWGVMGVVGCDVCGGV